MAKGWPQDAPRADPDRRYFCDVCQTRRPVYHDPLGPGDSGGDGYDIVCLDCGNIVATFETEPPQRPAPLT